MMDNISKVSDSIKAKFAGKAGAKLRMHVGCIQAYAQLRITVNQRNIIFKEKCN